jgi:hypothetical protein
METRLHKALASLFGASEGSTLSADETEGINIALAQMETSDVPESQAQNVKDYIDAQLLHNPVAPQVRHTLERLYERMQAR